MARPSQVSAFEAEERERVARLAELFGQLGAQECSLVCVLENEVQVPALEKARTLVAEECGGLLPAPGRLTWGEAWGVPIVVHTGTVAPHAGWGAHESVRSIRALARLQVPAWLFVRRARWLGPEAPEGSWMRVADHLHLEGESGLFPGEGGLACPYDPGLGEALEGALETAGFAGRGVYAGWPGCSGLTPQEARGLFRLGARAAGRGGTLQVNAAFAAGEAPIASCAWLADPWKDESPPDMTPWLGQLLSTGWSPARG